MASRLGNVFSVACVILIQMKITIRRLRQIIRESIKGGSHPDESYDKELMDDPAFEKDSVYVPNWAKKKIRKWAKDMKLSS